MPSSSMNLSFESQWCLPPMRDAWFLTGPTASGKSAVSLELAKKIDAEIISMDSMAVYQDMNIGTAKPTVDDRREVEHHLIDVVAPTDEYSLSKYVMAAHRKADEVRSRGRQVLFVGGTPLYLKSLLRGMFLGPPPDEVFREQIEQDVEQFGIEPLRARLAAVDPLSAFKILPNDKRRMIRALEVARSTGFPISHWQTQFDRISPDREQRVFAIGWARGDLHSRVERRVNQMIQRGLIDEVEHLINKYQQLSKTAMQAVGYKEPMAFLSGMIDAKEMINQIISHTRQFVRRQEMWFRSLPEIHRIEVTDETQLTTAPQRILDYVT
jgi:tRNA dimethylallyltransferase